MHTSRHLTHQPHPHLRSRPNSHSFVPSSLHSPYNRFRRYKQGLVKLPSYRTIKRKDFYVYVQRLISPANILPYPSLPFPPLPCNILSCNHSSEAKRTKKREPRQTINQINQINQTFHLSPDYRTYLHSSPSFFLLLSFSFLLIFSFSIYRTASENISHCLTFYSIVFHCPNAFVYVPGFNLEVQLDLFQGSNDTINQWLARLLLF